ncbi:SIMPL domain-containing protein [Chloroflexota bacterium]
MRKGLLLVIGVVLVVSILLVGCTADQSPSANNGGVTWSSSLADETLKALQSFSNGSSQQSGMWVSGTGKVTVIPDVAIISLGVEVQATTVADASGQAAVAMDAIVASLTANGVTENNIKTQRFNISQVTKWVDERSEQVVIGYRVTNMVTAKITDLDKAGIIIDSVAEAGGDLTRTQGISFTVDDPEPYYDQAREIALLNAVAKAEQMAEIVGIDLGKPVYITESGGYIPRAYPAPEMAFDSGASTTSISAGELEISISVQIGYDI